MDMQRNERNAIIKPGQTKPIQPSIVPPSTLRPLILCNCVHTAQHDVDLTDVYTSKRLLSLEFTKSIASTICQGLQEFCLKCQNDYNVGYMSPLNLKIYVH